MIRSTKTTLDFCNLGKLTKLHQFIDEYKNVIGQFVDILWKQDKIQLLMSKDVTSQITTWLSARAIQCAGKQASGIVRGTRKKQEKRLYQINKFKENGCHKKAKILQQIYDNINTSKPKLNDIECELDERFVKIEFGNVTSFDGWLVLGSLGNNFKLRIPFKKHKHFNSLASRGKIKNGIRLSKRNITFMFELESPKQREVGKILGIDVGQTTTLSCSDGQLLDKCPHGHNYSTICKKLSRKKKGSRNFQKTAKHRSNYLRYIVNKLNLDDVKIVNRENIRQLRKFANVKRRMQHWNYAELFDVLDQKFETQGVLVNKLNPTYTSQRCSHCGWTRKLNRKQKRFKCDKCSFEHDADLNASLNLSFNLVPIGKQERLQRKNRIGFYWPVVGKEPIVPRVQKVNES